MSFPLSSEQASALREQARTLAARASDHEHRLDALVEATEMHLRQAEAALSHSFDDTRACVDHLQRVLRTQMQHIRDEAAAAKELGAEAHEQFIAAVGFLTHLDGDSPAHTEARAFGPASISVLVADDYPELRESIAAVLRNAGFVVRTAANGLEARLIKAADATRHTRVIAYTGNAEADTAPARTLFAAVLHKPISPADVVATVQQVANL